MKYSRILFPLKNDSLLVNMLPVIEHSVKNIRKGKVPKTVLKFRMVVPPTWIFLLSLMCKKIKIRRPLFQSYRRVQKRGQVFA